MNTVPSESKTILLVEDESVNKAIKSVLEKSLGMPVVIAERVDEAVTLLEEQSPFAIIIIDIMMTPAAFPHDPATNPLQAGYQLARNIRKGNVPGSRTPPAVLILFFTAVASTSLINECKELFGDENVFVKPCGPDELVRRIREIFNAKGLLIDDNPESPLAEKLEENTPFIAWDVASGTEEALKSTREEQQEYAVVLVMADLSQDEQEQLTSAFGSEKVLVKPPWDNSLPGKLACFLGEPRDYAATEEDHDTR